MGEKVGIFEELVIRAGAFYQGAGLTPQGKPNYKRFVQGVIYRKIQPLSQQIDILAGYRFLPEGTGCLARFKKGGLLLPNYLNEGPLRGFWHTILSSFLIKELADEEPRWIQSHGNKLVWPVHVRSAESTNGILVKIPGEPQRGTRDIREALLNGDVVGLYPEGYPHKSIEKSANGAGRIINLAARREMPLIAASVWPEGLNLRAYFQSLDPQEVLDQQTHSGNFVLGKIAEHLPVQYRGEFR